MFMDDTKNGGKAERFKKEKRCCRCIILNLKLLSVWRMPGVLIKLRNCAGFEISRQPICCAVSIHHRLADKNRLTIQDLYGERLMLMHRNWSHYVDVLRDDIWQNHNQIQIVDFDFYSVDVFNRCENSNDVLMAVWAWDNVHPLLKVIPVEWNHSIPYGLLHSPTPSETVKRFLSAIQTVLH
mgnify:FL=1